MSNLPGFSVTKLLDLEGRLLVQLNSLTHIEKISIECVGELTDFILSEMKGPWKSLQEARESVRSVILRYLNLPFNRIVRAKLARHAAGCEGLFRLGRVFKPWTILSKPSWACIHVTEVVKLCTRKPRYEITLVSHAGPTVTTIWNKVLPASYIKQLIKSMGGRKYGKYMCEDIFNLWFTAKVHGDKNGLVLTDIHTSSSQQKLNKELLKAREGKCIGDFTKGNCMLCPYGLDKCKLARHKHTYIRDTCRNTEPAHSGYIARHGYCLYCLSKGNYTEAD
jgi:hypothetical protein